jgi:hypothetical protein
MIEDMAARKLGRHFQRSHIYSCKRFAAFLKRSPDTATADDIRRVQLHLAEAGLSICNRNRIMTGVRFQFCVTLRRHDLAAEVYHLKEPQKLPLTVSREKAKRLLVMAGSLKVHVMLALGYGCGLRAVRSSASRPATSIARRSSSASYNPSLGTVGSGSPLLRRAKGWTPQILSAPCRSPSQASERRWPRGCGFETGPHDVFAKVDLQNYARHPVARHPKRRPLGCLCQSGA